MQASPGQDAALSVRRGRDSGGAAAGSGGAAAGSGKAAFRDSFVSLVGPAGLLDMAKCSETAGMMRRAALESGYRAGARMSSALACIFADMSDMAGRPVEDGALHHTSVAFRHMMAALYDTARAYRNGEDREPVAGLEDARDSVARLRSEADAYREALRAAGPPGSALTGLDVWYKGRICGDVVRKGPEEARARQRERGNDPVFPPEPRSIDEFLGDDDAPASSADMIDSVRGKGP